VFVTLRAADATVDPAHITVCGGDRDFDTPEALAHVLAAKLSPVDCEILLIHMLMDYRHTLESDRERKAVCQVIDLLLRTQPCPDA
jgi:hypothetical protein